jgi:hypothetical protein
VGNTDHQTARTALRARNPERRGIPNGAESQTAPNSKGRGLPNGGTTTDHNGAIRRRDTGPQPNGLRAVERLCPGRRPVPPWRHALPEPRRPRRRRAGGRSGERSPRAVHAAAAAARQATVGRGAVRRREHRRGLGRGRCGARDRPLQIARGEAEEAIRHLRANFRANRVGPKDYWPIHNLLAAVVKMLNVQLNRGEPSAGRRRFRPWSFRRSGFRALNAVHAAWVAGLRSRALAPRPPR